MLADVSLDDPSFRMARLFRRRFRLPKPVFLKPAKLVKQEGWFSTRDEDVAAGGRCIAMEFKGA